MRLHAHDYRAPDTSGIVDGAILMHREVAELLDGHRSVAWHDLTRGAESVASASPGEVVYAGAGPYAFLYHLWRERTKGRFRIVREVHTALWSGYWAQEELCAPLLRPGDLVLFPTEYTRRLFIRHLASVTEDNSAVAYPMLDRLPRLPRARIPAPDEPLRIGYLGALSLAKNFDQVLSVFARCHRASGGRVSLLCAGKPNHPRWETGSVLAELGRQGVEPDAVRVLGVLGQNELAGFFSEIDVLLFPSTASRETLGRVVLEALAHGIPVLGADIGPAVELLPARNLVPTVLDTTTAFSMGRVEALGWVDEDALVDKLCGRDFEPADVTAESPYQDRTFLRALSGDAVRQEIPHDARLTGRLTVERRTGVDLDRALARSEQIFTDFFRHRDDGLLSAVDALPAESAQDRRQLRRLVTEGSRNLADYRAFPRLLDALVLPPLGYGLTPEPVSATHGKDMTA
ncbi:glycosyltransferase [Streptomyces sp. NPDC021098]|uniref:glycosyltransferase n=1 Tax=unclassified Streptomyces TaxID=2593676 RepID=UPI00378881B9